ncbi:MAG TPA: hypothetical protein VGD84_12735 [Pseudonocardiaceae bacterium]
MTGPAGRARIAEGVPLVRDGLARTGQAGMTEARRPGTGRECSHHRAGVMSCRIGVGARPPDGPAWIVTATVVSRRGTAARVAIVANSAALAPPATTAAASHPAAATTTTDSPGECPLVCDS